MSHHPTLKEAFEIRMKDPVFAARYETMSSVGQQLIRNYPYEVYTIKDGSPGPFLLPGTIVHLQDYETEGKQVKIVIKPENKMPQMIELEKELVKSHMMTAQQMHDKAIVFVISPDWLKPYFEE